MVSSINNFLTVSTKLAILLTHKHKGDLGFVVCRDGAHAGQNSKGSAESREHIFKYKKITTKKITFSLFFPEM